MLKQYIVASAISLILLVLFLLPPSIAEWATVPADGVVTYGFPFSYRYRGGYCAGPCDESIRWGWLIADLVIIAAPVGAATAWRKRS